MWYKKKRFVAAIVAALWIGIGGLTGFDLTNLESVVVEMVCQSLECVE